MTPADPNPSSRGSEVAPDARGPTALVEALDHLLDPLDTLLPVFRSPRSTAAAGGFAAATEAASRRPQWQLCTVLCWRGYVKSQFYAARTGRDGNTVAIATSPIFRSRGHTPAEDDPRAVAAHSALVEELTARGWEPVGRDGRWYEAKFRRQGR
jgi:hypothetical protein